MNYPKTLFTFWSSLDQYWAEFITLNHRQVLLHSSWEERVLKRNMDFRKTLVCTPSVVRVNLRPSVQSFPNPSISKNVARLFCLKDISELSCLLTNLHWYFRILGANLVEAGLALHKWPHSPHFVSSSAYHSPATPTYCSPPRAGSVLSLMLSPSIACGALRPGYETLLLQVGTQVMRPWTSFLISPNLFPHGQNVPQDIVLMDEPQTSGHLVFLLHIFYVYIHKYLALHFHCLLHLQCSNMLCRFVDYEQ
jgi:hypothetical protein